CSYPDNATPTCSASNVCGFTCPSNLTPVGSDCACVAPNQLCNGACTAVTTCPSANMRRRDAHLVRSGTICPAGTERCGVWRQWAQQSYGAYDCVDTRTDLESCGGCVNPLAGDEAAGRDCTQIPGVSAVRCSAGECQVQSCREGWSVASDGHSCV
ncbi:hypothetical protein FB451DRAFT_1055731, partial [Mycena latifolia]